MTTTQQRPLPAGVAGLSQITRPRPESREATPGGTLIIGQGIRFKGEIDSCRNLVVEGQVEASLSAESLTVLKDGLYKGTAEVDKVDIAGTFDGTLTVRGQLAVKSSGRVSGKIRYARINVEGGGEISGDVALGAESATPAKGQVASV